MATALSMASAPLRDSSGLITGYSGVKSTQGSQTPLYNEFGLINGYSNSVTKSPAAPYVDPNDPTGAHAFNPMTGLNKQGKTRGEQAALDYQQSTALVKNVKSPEIASATSNALKQENDLSSGVIKSFADYLKEAKDMQMQSKDQVNRDTATLNAAPQQLQTGLSKVVEDFANSTNALDSRVTDLNKQNEATVNANIGQLDTLNANYEANARAVADRALAAAYAKNNLAASVSGTPRSGSGYLNSLAARTTSDVLLPVESEISRNRISQLTNYITPQQQQLYANHIAQVTGLELPVANALASMGISNASQVSQLQASLAGRSLSEQIQFLSSLGLPIEMAQRIAVTLPQAIGALANIDQANTFYGLAQDYQPPINAPLPTYNAGVPSSYPPPPQNRNYSPYPTAPNVAPGYTGGYVPPVVSPPVVQPPVTSPPGRAYDGFYSNAAYGAPARRYGTPYQAGFDEPDTHYGGTPAGYIPPQQVDDYAFGYGQYA